MTASARARNLAMACRGTAQMVGVRAEQGDEDWLLLAIDRQEQAEAALLAYVARLEAVERAARSVALCLAQMPGWSERTMQSDREHILLTRDDLLTALKALDRPEDGETK